MTSRRDVSATDDEAQAFLITLTICGNSAAI